MLDFDSENTKLDRICKKTDHPISRYATVEVAAGYLAVTPRQVRHLCQLGHIGEKYGPKTWIITREELITFKPNKPALGRPKIT